MSNKLKLRCQKPNHKYNPIQFICLNPDCKQIKPGCFMCFPDHDGHTRQNIEIEAFLDKLTNKEKKLEIQYQSLFNLQTIKKYKDTLIRSIQQQFKALTSKLFNFLDRHCESIVQHISLKNFNDYQSQLKVKSYHDELERIRTKPTQTLENKDIEFLLQFLLSTDYDLSLEQAIQQKDRSLSEFQYEINQIPVQFEFQFNEVTTQLDQWLLQLIQVPSPQNFRTNESLILSKSPVRNKRQVSPFRTPSQFGNRSKTPETSSKKKYQQSNYNVQRLLVSTPEKLSQDFIYQDKQLEMFIQYCQLNFLKEDYLTETLQFFKSHYPDIFDMSKITQKDRIQLIYEQKANLLYILWDNLMIEWLKPSFSINQIQIKVHEIEDNFNSFNELFEKSLKIHDIVAWLIKQKISKPKPEFQTWLLLAQRSSRSYRLYSIKSAQKKGFKDLTTEDSFHQTKLSIQQQYLPKVLQDHLDGDFLMQRDVKILIKGNHDPNFQTYLLAERLQVYLNLVTNPQVAINLTFSQVEKHLDQVLIDFKSFVGYLHMSLKDLSDQ